MSPRESLTLLVLSALEAYRELFFSLSSSSSLPSGVTIDRSDLR